MTTPNSAPAQRAANWANAVAFLAAMGMAGVGLFAMGQVWPDGGVDADQGTAALAWLCALTVFGFVAVFVVLSLLVPVLVRSR